jgi:hypothetical protein
MEKRQPLQQMLLGKLLSACKKTNTRSLPSPCTNINSKWIKNLNTRPKTLQSEQKRAGNALEAIHIGKDSLSRTPAAQQLRERMDMKFKSFCTTKEMVSKLKRPLTE